MASFCHKQKIKQKEQTRNPANRKKSNCFHFPLFPFRLVCIQILTQQLKTRKTFGKLFNFLIPQFLLQ